MSSILSRLFGQQSGGLLGGQQVIPQGLMGPVQPPVQGPPAPTFLQNLERGSTRLVETPGFTNALTKLGTTLLTAREQGRSPGLGLALGAEGFLGELQQAQAAQQQASRQTLQDALLAAQTQQATAGTAKTVAETGLLGQPAQTSRQKDLIAAGIDPASPQGQDILLQSLTKPMTQINIGGDKIEEERAKQTVKVEGEFAAQGRGARTSNISLKQIKKSILDGTLDTGKLAPLKLAVGSFAKSFGFNPADLGIENLSTLEGFRGISSQLTLQAADQISGALSDNDLALLRASVPQLPNTTEGNARITDFQIGLNDRKIEVAKEAKTWQKRFGRLDATAPDGSTFDDVMAQLAETSIFPEAAQTTFTSMQAAEAANLPRGTEITINGRRAIVE